MIRTTERMSKVRMSGESEESICRTLFAKAYSGYSVGKR